MTDPIRMLHFADIHIGMENYGRIDPETGLNTRVLDFLRRMDEMIEYARNEDIDLTIFAGDAFKTRTPNPTFQREFAWRVRDLIAIAPLVLLVGNHDLQPNALKASSIEIYDTLAVPNVWVADKYEWREIQTKRGPVAVGAAPYPLRARVLQDVGTHGLSIAETDTVLQAELARIIEAMAAEVDAFDMPRVLTGHFTINGAAIGSERQIMLGRDIQLAPSVLADPRWDYVAMGHVHKHQDISAGRAGVPPIVYSGSMERIDFGEEGDPKGFCRVDLARNATTWHFQTVRARPFLTLRMDLRESADPTQEALNMIDEYDVKHAVVRMILQLTPETAAQLNEAVLREKFRTDGASFIATIRKEIEQPARARLGESPEGLSDLELLERYLMSKDVPLDRRQQLVSAADTLLSEHIVVTEDE